MWKSIIFLQNLQYRRKVSGVMFFVLDTDTYTPLVLLRKYQCHLGTKCSCRVMFYYLKFYAFNSHRSINCAGLWKNIILRNIKNFIVAVVLCVKNINKINWNILQKKDNELGSNENIIYCFKYSTVCQVFFIHYP